MTERQSSGTARAVAMLRAAHQVLDADPRILRDPVIVRLLGDGTEHAIRAHADKYDSAAARGLRSHVVLRSRVAEDRLADAVARGVTQCVILGAGFDTFAYRQPSWSRTLSITEVDHPGTQQSKRDALRAAGIALPPNVHFADIDFEHETLADGLQRCGVSRSQPTFFSWLGVTMYLTRAAIDAVLNTIAGFPKESELVLTFAQPPDPENTAAMAIAEGAAQLGEPWLSYFTPQELDAMLRDHGFSEVWFLAREEAMRRYFVDRTDGLVAPGRVSIAAAVV